MKRLLIIISVFTYLFYSCSEDDSNNIINEPDYFPNTVGSYWVYERYDSLAEKTDTITVSITGDTLISGDLYKIWIYTPSYWLDTLFVQQTNDSVIFYNPRKGRIEQLYIIPFEPGQGWLHPDYYDDTSYVAGTEDIVIEGITYNDVMIIIRDGSGYNYYLREKIWFKPHLGLVQLYKEEYNTAPCKNEDWRLIEISVH